MHLSIMTPLNFHYGSTRCVPCLLQMLTPDLEGCLLLCYLHRLLLFFLLQGALMNEIVRLSSHIDGLLLIQVLVLGVPSPPHQVLANDTPVLDFSYRTDTKVSMFLARQKVSA